MDEKIWTTYRMADGSLIYGEYAWVEHAEFFEGTDEPTEVIKETWILQESETVVFNQWDEDEYEEYADDWAWLDDTEE